MAATSSATAAAPPPVYVQGRDYDAKIAFDKNPFSAPTADEVRNLERAGLVVSLNDLITNVMIWSDDGQKKFLWTSNAVQKLGGQFFYHRIPMKYLIGGFEGRIITVPQRGQIFRFLCAQRGGDFGTAFETTRTEIVENLFKLNEDDFIKETLTSFVPSIPVAGAAPVSAPSQGEVHPAKRKEVMFQFFQKEWREGNTGFTLKVSDGQNTESISAHPRILRLNSKFFKETLSSEMVKEFEVQASPAVMRRLVGHLYDVPLEGDLAVKDCLDLIELNAKFQFSSETCSLYEQCLLRIQQQMQDGDVWTIIELAARYHLQPLLNVVIALLIDAKGNLCKIKDPQDMLNFMEQNWKSEIVLIPFFCEQLRAHLIQTKDAKLWDTVYEFSKKHKSDHVAANQLHEACISLATLFPPFLDHYIQRNSEEAINQLVVVELREKIREATKLQCPDVLGRCRQILGL